MNLFTVTTARPDLETGGSIRWPHLEIDVVRAIGSGQTELSAFDDALFNCGVHNFNLLTLSSVIPPASSVNVLEHCNRRVDDVDHGRRLYVVRAEQRTAISGTTVGAGVGWVQWGDGRGLFVEHELASATLSVEEIERTIKALIRASLEDLLARRALPLTGLELQSCVIAGRMTDQPICALALAVFEAEGWRGTQPAVDPGSPR